MAALACHRQWPQELLLHVSGDGVWVVHCEASLRMSCSSYCSSQPTSSNAMHRMKVLGLEVC